MEFVVIFSIHIILFIICIAIIIKIYTKLKKVNYDYNIQIEQNKFLLRELERNKFQYNLLYRNINSNKKVLIGDYNKDSLKNTIQVIEKFNLQYDVVTSSDDIIDKINHNLKYDLIITNNIYKHGCDGITLLKKLKKLDNFNTPIIINTISQNEKNYFVNTCGFDDYIEKPINEKKFKPIYNKYLNEKK